MTHWTLVTGANRGLGLEFVRQLLADGMRVVATCRQPGKATALNTLAAEHPGHLKVLPLDVGDARSRDELVREWPLAAGEDARIGLLINNAGVLHSGERFGTLTADTLDDSLRTNVTGPLLLTQALAPLLRDGARVANLSSQLGSIANTGRFGTPSYAISKAALNMATVQLAHALRERGKRQGERTGIARVRRLCPADGADEALLLGDLAAEPGEDGGEGGAALTHIGKTGVERAYEELLRGQVGYVDSPEVVSTDFVGSDRAGVVDGLATLVNNDGKNAILYVWYDNEYGYSHQVIRVVEKMAGQQVPAFPQA